MTSASSLPLETTSAAGITSVRGPSETRAAAGVPSRTRPTATTLSARRPRVNEGGRGRAVEDKADRDDVVGAEAPCERPVCE
jgi:hypothetical protein